jgi:hypothetical protein
MILLASLALGCGKKAESVQAPLKRFSWAEGQYLGDRYVQVPKNPSTITDLAFKVAADAVIGTASQSIQNTAGGLPERIACRFTFSGPLTEKADGNATFDISGTTGGISPVAYHVTGTIAKTGTSDFFIESTSDTEIAELVPLETIGEKDIVPANVHAPQTSQLPAPTKKTKKKAFTMQSQGFAVKR